MSRGCRWNFLEMNSWRPHPSLERERKILRCVFTSSVKRAIRKFNVLVVQWRQRNVPKRVMHVQSCCLGHKTYCFFDVFVAIAVALLKLPTIPKKNTLLFVENTCRHGIYLFVVLFVFLSAGLSISVGFWQDSKRRNWKQEFPIRAFRGSVHFRALASKNIQVRPSLFCA